MSNKTQKKYANLPLCFLAFGDSMKQRTEHAISYGVVDAALNSNFIDTLSDGGGDAMNAVYDYISVADNLPSDVDTEDEGQCRILFAAKRLGMRLGSMKSTLKQHRALDKFVKAYEEQHGKDARTKIHFDLLFRVCDGRSGITEGEFRVFAAINSNLGKHRPITRMTQSMIRSRALGFKAQRAFDIENAKRTDKATPLANHAISRATDRLVMLRFFKKLSLPRATYYGQAHLTEEKFAELVFAQATKRMDDDKRRKRMADDLAEQIRKRKDEEKKQRVVKRRQGDALEVSPTVKFHLVNELRAQFSSEEFDVMMKQPNARRFTVNGQELFVLSFLPAEQLRAMYAETHNPSKSEPDDELVF